MRHCPISIHKAYQISQLIKEIEKNLPIQSKIYDSDFLTDKSLTFRACEIIRENIEISWRRIATKN